MTSTSNVTNVTYVTPVIGVLKNRWGYFSTLPEKQGNIGNMVTSGKCIKCYLKFEVTK